MHGGQFPKATKLKASPQVFDVLGFRCDGSHPHASWGVRKSHGTWKFDTADETMYPKLLVQRMVDCVTTHVQPSLLDKSWKHFRFDLLQQAGIQHRLQPPLIPEYASIEWLPEVPVQPPCKVLQTPWTMGDTDEGFACDVFEEDGISEAHDRQQAAEDILRKTMPDHINTVTRGKPLCLFRQPLAETVFPDMEVCTIMERGVPLTGEQPLSPLHYKKYRRAMMTPQQLDHQAIWRRKAMVGKSMTDDELAQEKDLEAESMVEVEAGFLLGPFSTDAIPDLVGSEQWSLSKRFALYQGEERKIRIIDNYRDSAVNASFASSSYLALHDTDFVIGFLRFIMWVVSNGHEVVVPMSDGVFYDDFPCFEVEPLAQLTAKSLDSFFNVLGWKHAVTGKKATDNLQDLWRGRLTVQNKAGRRDRIMALTADLRQLRSGSKDTAASLAGILKFSGGGHSLKPATHAKSKWSSGGVTSTAGSGEICDLVEFLVDASKPRVIAMDNDLALL
eukprot:s2653_g6.t1